MPDLVRVFSGSQTSVTSTTEVPLQIDTSSRYIEISRVVVSYITGSCLGFQPGLGIRGSYKSGTPEEFYLATSSSISTKVDDAAIGALCQTDATGSIYLRFAPNTSTDNAFQYMVCVKSF